MQTTPAPHSSIGDSHMPDRSLTSPLRRNTISTTRIAQPRVKSMYNPEDVAANDQLQMHVSLARNLSRDMMRMIYQWKPNPRDRANPFIKDVNLWMGKTEEAMQKIVDHQIDLVGGRRLIIDSLMNLQVIERQLNAAIAGDSIAAPASISGEPRVKGGDGVEGKEKGERPLGRLKRGLSFTSTGQTKRRAKRLWNVVKEKVIYGQPAIDDFQGISEDGQGATTGHPAPAEATNKKDVYFTW